MDLTGGSILLCFLDMDALFGFVFLAYITFNYKCLTVIVLISFVLKDAAAFWNQQPFVAREYASSTIIPACNVVADISNSAKDFIDKEVSAFYRSPDNSLYMLPSSPQVCKTETVHLFSITNVIKID